MSDKPDWKDAPEWATVLLKSGSEESFCWAKDATTGSRALNLVSMGAFVLDILYWSVVETREDSTLSKTEAVKSSGGSSNYYKVELPQWLLDKQKENGHIMLEDLAEVMYGNDFNFTNVMKAQKRMYELTQGGGKEGNSFEYDATKVKYYTDKQIEVFNRQ